MYDTVDLLSLWFYHAAMSILKEREAMKLGRNAPCDCGSGKKYKRCCLRKDEQESSSARGTVFEDQPEASPDSAITVGLGDLIQVIMRDAAPLA